MQNIEIQLEILRNMTKAFVERFDKQDNQIEAEFYLQDIIVPTATHLFEGLVADRHAINSTNSDEVFAVHFTSLASLFGMFEQGGMRLYDSHFVNDPNEGRFFDEHSNLSESLYSFCHDIAVPVYMASFTITGQDVNRHDQLNYWRLYGDQCRGCSILIPMQPNVFRRVLYGQQEVEKTAQTLRPILDDLVPLAEISPKSYQLLSEAIHDALSTLRYLYKSEDYKDEYECRMILTSHRIDASQLHFDTEQAHGGSAPVRHYCYDKRLNLDSILGRTGSLITLGPSVSDYAEITYAIEAAFGKLAIRPIPIERSSKTYRSS